MIEWVEKKLNDVCEIGRGSSPRPIADQRYFINGEIPWIKIADATKSNKYIYETKEHVNEYGASFSRMLQPGALIIAASGTLGFPMFLGVEGCIHDGWLYFNNYKGISPDYLYYRLITLRNYFNALSYGAAIQNINTEIVRNTQVSIPPLATQARIAEILSAYDDAIENNRRRIALLEKVARELYHEWFVRMRFPGHESAKFVGGLPDGWDVVPFGTLVEIIDGDRGTNYPKQGEFSSEGYCLFLNAGNVTKNGFNFANSTFVTEEKDKILRKGRLERNDIVLTTRGTVGNVAFYSSYIPYNVLRINSGMVILRDSGCVSPEFLYMTLRNESVQKMIALFSSGSAQPQLPIKDMRKMKILKPTNNLVQQFAAIIKAKLNKSALLQTQSQNLARQRDLLLPRLMSGKLEV